MCSGFCIILDGNRCYTSLGLVQLNVKGLVFQFRPLMFCWTHYKRSDLVEIVVIITIVQMDKIDVHPILVNIVHIMHRLLSFTRIGGCVWASVSQMSWIAETFELVWEEFSGLNLWYALWLIVQFCCVPVWICIPLSASILFRDELVKTNWQISCEAAPIFYSSNFEHAINQNMLRII